MTSPPARLLFDASPLLHSAKADRLDVLGDLVRDAECVTTRAVLDEIGRRHTDALCTVTNASVLVDDLHTTGMRLPFAKGGFESWAREKKLLG
ncbi:hypothetical protein [Nocardiopsis trehalosi]|uniref:hypothetical protein n=1 Tax=Nocardiopsis trehalosi TaxID=109329 RepID=UPI00082F1FC4|nr:hypothetical protein [Nocardiopsis trehalosi]